jgi:hypothetical protein
MCVMDSYGSRQGQVGSSYEHSNEPSGSTDVEFLDWLSDYQLLKKDSVPWS